MKVFTGIVLINLSFMGMFSLVLPLLVSVVIPLGMTTASVGLHLVVDNI